MENNNTFLNELKDYFETTLKEKILQDWNKTQDFDNIKPTMDDFLETQNKAASVGVSPSGGDNTPLEQPIK